VAVLGLDHVVLIVRDAEASVAWYRDKLGLEPLRLEEWRQGAVPFPSMRVDEGTILDLLPGRPDGRNVDHLCLVVDEDAELLAATQGLEVIDGPAVRWGARGNAVSVYVPDPDGHVVELRRYGGVPA
jgi:catechol 2,3-dioxygenase-like lactoylglutathione lyase family enzyme